MIDAELDPDLQRLRWQCRRGMLELDLLLGRFLETSYKALTEREKVAFNRLLGYQDQILYDWLMGYAVAADRELRELVPRIRDAAHC
ncbi:MAG: succinate dehydrogenase assembly factor 2 [Chromatiaceae bacterium]